MIPWNKNRPDRKIPRGEFPYTIGEVWSMWENGGGWQVKIESISFENSQVRVSNVNRPHRGPYASTDLWYDLESFMRIWKFGTRIE